MSNIYNMLDTWNNGPTVFTAIKMNVTDTASAAGSLLLDLQVGGVSKLNVSKTGTILTSAGYSASAPTIGQATGGIGFSSGASFFVISGACQAAIGTGGILASAGILIGWAAGAADGGAADTAMVRASAGVIKVTNGGAGIGYIQTPGTTVAALLAAATAGAGARSFVTDGSVVAAGNFGTIVAGAGANGVPVYCDGTNWRIG